jgi:ABC-type uncharacterized transport system involved in gliding motility auxiliary subunit
MNKKRIEGFIYSSVGVAGMFVVLLAVNGIMSAFKQRIDLTAEKLYTLSPGTKAILAKVDVPVKIRFYCTQGENEMPVFLKTYAQRVEDLLAEYKQWGKGNIRIEKLDPRPDSDAEDSANLDGVEGQQTQTGEKIYLGLSFSCLDQKAALRFLSPEAEKQLEYEISRTIAGVASPSKRTIGIMTPLPIFGAAPNPMMMRMGRMDREEPWIIVNQLKSVFEVRQVEMTADRIDDDISVLMVVHPRDITEKAQYAIDQFIMRGGRLLAFLDPNCVIDSRNQNQNPGNPLGNMPVGSSLDRLLKTWGIEFDKGKVVADRVFQSRMQNRGTPQAAPAVLSMNTNGVNTADVVTSQIDSLLIPFPGAFAGTPADGLKQTVLLQSTEESQLVESFIAQLSGEQVLKDFKPAGKKYAIALRLTGKFKTAFPEGRPADAPGGEKKADDAGDKSAGLKEAAKETSVVLVADADILFDQFCVQIQEFFGQRIVIPRNGNLAMVQNIVEQLGGDNNLIGVRSRATMSRPFTRIRAKEAQAQDRYRDKIKELEAGLQETQRKLNELQQNKDKAQRFILSPEQQKELANFRAKEGEAKKELKQVRKTLSRDIESLENRIKWANIAGMPFLVTLSGIVLAVFKKKRTAAK